MSGPSGAKEATEGFQRLLAAQDAKASAQVVRAYAPVYQRLQRDTRALVTIAQTRGLKPWQVMRMQRMKDLQTQFRASAARFATAAGDTITEAQRAAVGRLWWLSTCTSIQSLRNHLARLSWRNE